MYLETREDYVHEKIIVTSIREQKYKVRVDSDFG